MKEMKGGMSRPVDPREAAKGRLDQASAVKMQPIDGTDEVCIEMRAAPILLLNTVGLGHGGQSRASILILPLILAIY